MKGRSVGRSIRWRFRCVAHWLVRLAQRISFSSFHSIGTFGAKQQIVSWSIQNLLFCLCNLWMQLLVIFCLWKNWDTVNNMQALCKKKKFVCSLLSFPLKFYFSFFVGFFFVMSLWCGLLLTSSMVESSRCFRLCNKNLVRTLVFSLAFTHCRELMKSVGKLW